MSFKLLEILSLVLGCGIFFSCIIQWRKKYFDLKANYDILLLEIHKLKEDNKNLIKQTNTDSVK